MPQLQPKAPRLGTIESVDSTIYLDYAAATPLDEQVFLAMKPFLFEEFYNPSASYLAARRVRAEMEKARAVVAGILGAKPAEIIFTAGATEANNLAIHGVMRRHPGANAVVCSIEHEAILAPIRNYPHAIAPVTARGLVELEKLRGLIDDQTALVSIGYANNEIGTVQPLRQVAEIIAEVREQRRANGNVLPLYLHSDAAQATPYLDLHTARLGVDLLTINGSKMYGPKQVGALFVDAKVELQPQIAGGGQERGLRSGTENVAGIIGLAVALQKVQEQRKTEGERVRDLRDQLLHLLLRDFSDLTVNGDLRKRLPNNLNVSFAGCDGERILMAADEQGLQIATGAACSANKHTGSHVLKAIGCDAATADGSLRLTLGQHTTTDEISRAAAILTAIVKGMR